ncbi:MetQ/NlpA family ABC transporter substrate-binding protein [Metabacillus malikii]|uniref:Lipoprotein n=1 Tax=Metabacillus malikii TaxID=1504265 RepID=A0ABT9ZBP5_9BACI|nr:MetQ/NlpA family ABC transporter substrate-binding protein [Metabacillus malikii]MDQ0229689.1 D-methionine transport system substrate-binding protein [Metabacillus malikii]
MKKKLSLLFISLLLVALAACGTSKDEGAADEKSTKLVVGASAVPHAQILKKAEPILAKEGIELDVKVFQDYILPNTTLESKELDANYFQTPGYLALEMEEKGYDFVSVGEIHREPIGIYSKKYKSLDELPEGAKIIISTSDSDQGRILPIFEKAGLITLKEGVGENARVEDIVENPKKLDFSTRIEAKLLATSFNNEEGDAVVINANYALEGDVNLEEGIAFEGSDVVPANLIVVRKEDENNENIKKLVEVLKSEEIQSFIESEYKGSVIPVGKDE